MQQQDRPQNSQIINRTRPLHFQKKLICVLIKGENIWGGLLVNGSTHSVLGADLALGISIAIVAVSGRADGAIMRSACLTGGAVLGALLPDIDHPHSTIGHTLFFVSYPFAWIAKLFRKSRSGFLSDAFGHRGMTHSPAVAALLLILFLIPAVQRSVLLMWLCIGLFVGVVSHLLADMFNPTGVPLLWPISRRKISVARIVTGSFAENIVRFVGIAIGILSVIANFGLIAKYTFWG